MANFWDQDPIVESKKGGDEFWSKDPVVGGEKRDTGFTGAAKSTIERMKGETALTAGKIGLMDTKAAEEYAAQQEAKARQMFQPTQEGWTQAPVTKFKELLGGSLPYVAAPLAAGAAATLLPEAAAIGGIGAATLGGVGAATAQYIGPGLARQMETGKSLADTSLLNAGAAAFGEALLDRVSFGAIPGIRKIFQAAGKDVGEDVLKEVAKKGIMSSAGELALAGVKGATVEGATEAAQQFLERLQAGLSLTDKQARDEYFDNFIGGAVLGGTLAAPGHVTEKMFAPKQNVSEMQQEAPTPKEMEIYPTAEPVTSAGLEPINAPVPPMPIERKEAPAAVPEPAPIPTPAPAAVTPPAPPVEPPAAPPAPTVQPFQPSEMPSGAVLQNRNRKSPASIAQMNQIASAPDYDRVSFSKDFNNGAPVVSGALDIAPTQLGKQSVATTVDGRKIPVQYAVIEAHEVLPSNNADGSVNPAHGDTNYPGMQAIAGNGRVAGLQAAYQRGTADAYKAEMSKDDTHGINPEVIKGMANPILVRVMPQNEITPDIADISNTASNAELSAVEQAKNDVNRFDFTGLKFNDSGDLTPDSVYGFVKSMPTTEQNKLMDEKGAPTRQAVERLDNAIFQKAYNSDNLINLVAQAQDPEAKLVLKGLREAAPVMARLEGTEFDIRPQIIQAAEMAVNARRQGIPLSEMLKNADMTLDPNTVKVMQVLAENARSGKRIAERLNKLGNTALNEVEQGGTDMFGERPARTMDQVFDEGLAPEPELFERATPFTDKFLAEEKELAKRLRKALDDMGLHNVALRLEDTLHEIRDGKASPINGYYFQKLINLSLSGSNMFRTMSHEALHAMRDLGFFSDADWKLLTDKAKSTWMKKYNIAEDYADKSKEIQYEEAIAKAFADHKTLAPKEKSIMAKAINILKRIGNVLRGAGYRTANDVFTEAAAGKFTETKAPSAAIAAERNIVNDKEMDEVHNAQRDGIGLDVVPEDMMHWKKNYGINHSGKYQYAAEHIGDLVHRLSSTKDNQGGGHTYGIRAALDKVLARYDFKDMLAQVRRNAEAAVKDGEIESVKKFENEFIDAAYRYANAYEKIPVYTKFQELGRDAAIALGTLNFPKVQRILGELATELQKPNAEEKYFEKLSTSPEGLKAERTNAPPQSFTKIAPQQTAGEKLQIINANVKNAWNDNKFWTKVRNEWIDPSSGLTKSLQSEETFKDGQLRADMLNHAQAQSINLIKNGLLTGMPVLNKDGSIVIDESENNLARSQTIADSIDNNSYVKSSGLSGRAYIAEIARALRGKEIMEEDAARRKLGIQQLKQAKEAIKAAQEARDEKRPIGEIRNHLNRAKDLRKQGYENKSMNRELQVDQAQIDWAEKQLKNVPEVKQVLDIWKNVNDSLIKLWESVGLLTKDQADNYLSKKSYVPLFKSREDLSDQPTGFGGSGLKTPKKIKQLEGSMATRNIWENVEKHYASMVASAYQNQTRKVGSEQLKSFGLAEVTDATNPDVNLRYRDPTSEFADNQGIVHMIIENPNDLAAFQMMHYELGPIMKGMAAANQLLRAGALLNPMFWIKQLIRDPVHATLVTDSGIVTPFHAAKGYLDILRGDSREAGILARAGVIGQMDSTIDIHDFLKQVGQEKKTPSLLDKAIHKAMKFHEASDAATRVAIFKDQEKQALAKGMSKEDAVNYAVFKARESINFAIHGTSPILNNLRNMIPFLSASINSLDTVYRAATGYGLPPAEKKAAQMLFVKRAAMMSIMATAYAMMYQGDDDYKNLPDYTKDNNFLLPNPFGDGHTFIKIPVPFEVGFLFKTIPEATVRYMAGNSTGKEVLGSYLSGITNTIPGNGVLIPQAVKPGLEVITNHSFFTHRPIESVGEQNLPVAMRGARASEVSKQLSALGLDKVGLSPAKIDYLIQGYTAELGSFTTNMASSAVDLATGTKRTAKNIEEMPFFKSFMTNPKASKAIADFYDLEHTAQETVNEFNQYKKFGEAEKIKELMANEQNRKLIAAAPALRGIQSQMTNLRTQMKVIDQNQKMDPEIRRQRLNDLQTVYERLALQGEKIATAMKIER
jgi:hypothetical protein